MFSGQQTPGNPAVFIKLFEGHDALMGGDLENRIGRCVNDGIAGCKMFAAQFLYNFRSGSRAVAERSGSDKRFIFGNQGMRKAVRVGREGPINYDSGYFPMPDGWALANWRLLVRCRRNQSAVTEK